VNNESMTLAQVRARLEEADLMEREIAALKDRVRSLQSQLAELRWDANELDRERLSLQSQLAWTPVSDGLPTEPGAYEFLHGTYIEMYKLSELAMAFKWISRSGACFDSGGMFDLGHTHYRRIELPEAP